MSSFTHFNPVKICFDVPLDAALESIQALPYERYMLITSQGWIKRGIVGRIESALGKKLYHLISNISSNPELQLVQGIKQERIEVDAIIALGGGSVLDSAKFLSLRNSILAHNGELCVKDSSGSLKVLNEVRNVESKPIFAFPTTAGTSSELTQWATIWDKSAHIKYSLMHECLYAKMAFYDESLFAHMPQSVAVFSALDALSHAIESIWNKNATPLSQSYAKEAIRLIIKHLSAFAKDTHSLHDRRMIILASIYAGLAFSQTQTALAHALSYPITMSFDVPHGLACSFSLPILLQYITDETANSLLQPFKDDINRLFATLHISSNPRDYGLDTHFVKHIFSTLNKRAKNALLDVDAIKEEFLSYVS